MGATFPIEQMGIRFILPYVFSQDEDPEVYAAMLKYFGTPDSDLPSLFEMDATAKTTPYYFIFCHAIHSLARKIDYADVQRDFGYFRKTRSHQVLVD